MAVGHFVRASADLICRIDSQEDSALLASLRNEIRRVSDRVADELEQHIIGSAQKAKMNAAELKVRRQLAYQKNRRQKLQEEIALLRGHKKRGLVQPEMFARIGLSDPILNGYQLQRTLFSVGFNCVSPAYIGRIRDAFAELLKKFNSDQVAEKT